MYVPIEVLLWLLFSMIVIHHIFERDDQDIIRAYVIQVIGWLPMLLIFIPIRLVQWGPRKTWKIILETFKIN